MTVTAEYLTPSEAAARLGISAKALRLYEARGLVRPARTGSGWRAYGPDAMRKAAEIAALRALGLSLAQVGRVLAGDASDLEATLAAHQADLEDRSRRLAATAKRVAGLRRDLADGTPPALADLVHLAEARTEPVATFDLPWPWGGEPFALRELRRLTYITGPLGSGKTRLAHRLAETLPGASFVGLDRLTDAEEVARARCDADSELAERVETARTWLLEDGATASGALSALLLALEVTGPAVLVIDMVEQGLDEDTQAAVVAHLRRRPATRPPVLMLTRSSAILDMAALGRDEAILYCPANHAPPRLVEPRPGTPGYEAVASCLASPAVRARTEGVIAWRPDATARPAAAP